MVGKGIRRRERRIKVGLCMLHAYIHISEYMHVKPWQTAMHRLSGYKGLPPSDLLALLTLTYQQWYMGPSIVTTNELMNYYDTARHLHHHSILSGLQKRS